MLLWLQVVCWGLADSFKWAKSWVLDIDDLAATIHWRPGALAQSFSHRVRSATGHHWVTFSLHRYVNVGSLSEVVHREQVQRCSGGRLRLVPSDCTSWGHKFSQGELFKLAWKESIC